MFLLLHTSYHVSDTSRNTFTQPVRHPVCYFFKKKRIWIDDEIKILHTSVIDV